jgi:hypothetical protein
MYLLTGSKKFYRSTIAKYIENVGWPQVWFWRVDRWMGVKAGLRDCLAHTKKFFF